jgi:hypothetical protein
MLLKVKTLTGKEIEIDIEPNDKVRHGDNYKRISLSLCVMIRDNDDFVSR